MIYFPEPRRHDLWDHSCMTQTQDIDPLPRSAPSDEITDLLPPASGTELALTLIWRLVLTLVSGAGLGCCCGIYKPKDGSDNKSFPYKRDSLEK